MRRAMILGAVALVMTAAAGRAQSWSFDAAPGGLLEIDLRTGGSVEIRGGEADRVTVEATARGRDAALIRVEATKTAKGVRVRSEYTEKRRTTSGGADLVVRVPARYDVELSTMGGAIEIDGVEGHLGGESMGGGMVLTRLRGTLALKTMGGSIEVSDSNVDGRVETMGGNVTLRRVGGGLQGKTMGGRLQIEEPQGGGSFKAEASGSTDVVELETMGGDIDVASAPRGARVKTMGGDIRIDSAREFVEATTMGGRIRIREVDGRVEATSMSGDVEVHVVGRGGDVELQSMSGDVELWLPAGFDADFEVEIAYTQGMHRSYAIRSDFPLTESRTSEWEYGKGSPRKFIRGSGRTGAGTHTVRLNTVNGDIVIHRGD